MFVPRQVQRSYTVSHSAALSKSATHRKPTVVTAPTSTPKDTPTSTAAATVAATATNITKPGTIDIATAKAIVLVLEQLFSSENPHTQWLEERWREVDGHNDYLHLAALIECPYLKDHRPQLTQIIVRRALETAPSEILEISADSYHIRLSSNIKRTALLESHTVYIEPSTTNATRSPGRLALELQKMLPAELLPVKYTSNQHRSWVLLTLSSVVTDGHLYHHTLWPPGWIVLSQAEWKRRDTLYRARRKAALEARTHPRPHPPPAAHEEPKNTFEPGLIVYILHLHPGVNKPGISSFIMHAVDRYLRKRNPAEHKKVQINYIDYKKDGDSCYLRQATREDSELIVAALKKRRRAMREGGDRKGRKSNEGFVVGRLLEGEEEAGYWRKVEETMEENAGKKGRKKKGSQGQNQENVVVAATVNVDVRSAGSGKRPRLNLESMPEGKRKRFDR